MSSLSVPISDRFSSFDQEPKIANGQGPPPAYRSGTLIETDSWSEYSTSSAGLGKRRASWTNLVDSDENLNKHKVNCYPNVISVPVRNQVFDAGVHPSTHIPSVRTSSQQAYKSDIYQYRVEKSSLPILNESGPHPAGTLPPSAVPSKAPSVVEAPQAHFSPKPQKRNRLQEWKKMYTRPPIAACIVFLLVILIVAAVITIVLVQVLAIPKSAVMSWIAPEMLRGGQNLPNTINMKSDGQQVRFYLQGAMPFKGNFISYYDFKTNRVAIVDESLKNNRKNIACFVVLLDRNNVRDISSMLKASSNSVKRREQSRGWQETWNFLPSPLLINAQTLFDPPIPECEGVRWIQLEYTSSNQKSRKCSDCYDFCLPDYGIEKDNVRDEEYLNILRRNCFYLFVPEWRSFAQTNSVDQNQRDFETYYRNRIHLNPTNLGEGETKWISLSKIPRQVIHTVLGSTGNVFDETKKGIYNSNNNGIGYGITGSIPIGSQANVAGVVNLSDMNARSGSNAYGISGNMNSQEYGQYIINGNNDGNIYNQPQNVERTMAITDNGMIGMTQRSRELNAMGTPTDSLNRYENGNAQNQYGGQLSRQLYTSQIQNTNAYSDKFGHDGQFPLSSNARYGITQGTNTRQPYPDSNGINPPSGYIPQVGPQTPEMKPQGVAGIEIPSPHHSGYTPDVITNQQPVNTRWMTSGRIVHHF